MTNRAHSGGYALRLGNPTASSCPEPPPELAYLGRVNQALTQTITVPADAPGLTVSFWYYVEGAASSEVSIILSDNLYTSNYNSVETAYLDRLIYGDQPGWHLFRQVLNPTQLAFVKGLGTLKFQLRLDDPLTADEASAFYIDDVQVAAATITTAASQLPTALRSDGSRPLVYVRDDPQNPSYSDSIYRMNSDGSGAQQIFVGYLRDSGAPVWSPDGQRIALIDDNVYPLDETNPDKYVSATALVVINADGSGARSVHQTGGLPGNPDFISQISSLDWAPDGRTLAASFFDYLRYDSGRLEGGHAYVKLVDAAAQNQGTQILDHATQVSWSSTNRILFETYDLYGQSPRTKFSIAELDMSVQPPAERSLIADPALRYDTDNDQDAAWAPDGERFVTTRTISGNHYDAEGDGRYNHALMLFDRRDLANPRQLLLGDHGFIADPAWSPDGAFIVYTLSRDDKRDLWWLDVASGATGPLTSDGLSSSADWRTTRVSNVFLPLIRR
ncbi:MAG: PD40 domain-containing protein [Chloroflexales bacterium]|nr:PD40 domain-containing protein [Chloroflexales bacterium]